MNYDEKIIEEEYIYKINELSEEAKLLNIREDSMIIVYIEDPSEDLQLAAVMGGGYIIKYIDKPTEKVQIEAIKNLKYFEEYEDELVEEVITSKAAKELYKRLKKAYWVMK
jgi:hypothetical protein